MRVLFGTHHKLLITRKTLPSLRLTTMRTFFDVLNSWGMYNPRQHNKTDRVYKHGTNFIAFYSVDEPNKLNSAEWTDVFMDEATDFEYDDYRTLKLRQSGKRYDGRINQIHLGYNPNDEGSWIRKLEERDDADLIISTFRDNGFLTEDYVKELLKLREDDPEYWNIYGEGLWVKNVARIFSNWQHIDMMPEGDVSYGIDFGYNNPTAVVECRWNDCVPHLNELLYQTHLTNGELIERLKLLIPDTSAPIYADSAEPDRIREIENAGFNIYPANKAVRDGIDFVKRFPVRYTQNSVNIDREYKRYMWKKDKQGTITDDPVKFDDHIMDAVRYALYSHALDMGPSLYERNKAASMSMNRKQRVRRIREYDNY